MATNRGPLGLDSRGRRRRLPRKLSVMLLAVILGVSNVQPAIAQADSVRERSATEFFPILTYDTDVGVGYGAKAFALDHLGRDESFDLVLFNSTRGEQWYRLVFSIPDFERRQGTAYPLAVDVVFDYDKWIRSSFFGVGGSSHVDDRVYYTREPLEASVTLSRAFAPSLVGSSGARYRIINAFDIDHGRAADSLRSLLFPSSIRVASLIFVLRHDTRNSFIDPSQGLVVQGEAEVTTGDVSLCRLGLWAQHYLRQLIPGAVLAIRAGVQGVIGGGLPIEVLLPAGGGGTLRGYPQDRYLDKAVIIGNAECRFPIYWRLGGVAGVDCGRVWRKISDLSDHHWAADGVAGLRFHMDTFIVRLDVGMSDESTGLYLNFGQLF